MDVLEETRQQSNSPELKDIGAAPERNATLPVCESAPVPPAPVPVANRSAPLRSVTNEFAKEALIRAPGNEMPRPEGVVLRFERCRALLIRVESSRIESLCTCASTRTSIVLVSYSYTNPLLEAKTGLRGQNKQRSLQAAGSSRLLLFRRVHALGDANAA